MKVALVYNLKRDPQAEGAPIDYYSEFDSPETVESIAVAITFLGHEVNLIEADKQIVDKLRQHSPDIVFNIAEGKSGSSRESQIPAILDYLGIPYTGSGMLALALSLNKATAKILFSQQEIPTPRFQLFEDKKTALRKELTFPLIVKPNCEGSAKGITKNSVVYHKSELSREVDRIIQDYKQPVMVEEFIDGKELTVGVLGNGEFLDLPILEIDFSSCKDSGEYFYSWRMKEYQGNKELGFTPEFYCPGRLSDRVSRRVKEAAYKAHRILDCKDISRVDIRLSRDNVPYVLEVNPLPGLDPNESNLPLIARAYGMDYNRLIETVLKLAISRYDIKETDKDKSFCANSTITYTDPVGDLISGKPGGGKDAI